MKREPGFYWVKWRGKWEVCQWSGYCFWVCGVDLNNGELSVKECDKIDEKRIINPNE